MKVRDLSIDVCCRDVCE